MQVCSLSVTWCCIWPWQTIREKVLFSTVGSSGMDVIYIHAQQGTNNVTALRTFLFLEKNACFLNLYRKLTAIQCSVYIDWSSLSQFWAVQELLFHTVCSLHIPALRELELQLLHLRHRLLHNSQTSAVCTLDLLPVSWHQCLPIVNGGSTFCEVLVSN